MFKRKTKLSKEKQNIIVKVAIVMAVFGIIYEVLKAMGGEYKNFADRSGLYTFIGICAAGLYSYSKVDSNKNVIKNKNGKRK